MNRYFYVALDKHGREVSANIEAISELDAQRDLKVQGLMVISLEQVRDPKQLAWQLLGLLNPQRYKKVKTTDLLLFFRQMALLLRSGHTVVQALKAVAPMISRLRLRFAIEKMVQQIEGGDSFSIAMNKHQRIFPDFAISLIESGEATGETDKIMERLAKDLDKTVEIKRKLISSLSYPIIVVFAAIAVILFLVMSVVPKFATFLGARGAELPASTQALMDFSEWMQDNGFTLLVGVAVTVFGLLAFYTQPKGRLILDGVLLKLPLIGSSIIAASMAKTGWTLSMMIASGMTVLDSMKIAARVNNNHALRACFNKAAERVVNGDKLAIAIKCKPVPSMVLHLTAAGEASGELSDVFNAIGDYYHKELDVRIKTMTSMIEPLLTLMVGGMVGFVYLSFFQAIFAVATGGR